MNPRLRQQRTTFLLFLGAVYVSLMAALPIVTASMPQLRYRAQEPVASQPTFEQLDRNRDAKLDQVEYAKALAMIDGAR